jgi:hypothetical protein
MKRQKIPPFNVSLDEVMTILNHKETFIDAAYHSGPIKTDFEISPGNFLKYAEDDLSSTSTHKYINALSNAKRALDCQLDTLLVGFGFYNMSKKQNWGFPKKIEALKSLGLIAPRVLSKINKMRNVMEHEFKNPDSESVEDFIDIVALFIAATVSYTSDLMDNKYIGFTVNLRPEDGFVTLEADLHYSRSELTFNFSRSYIRDSISNKSIQLKRSQKAIVTIPSDHTCYKEVLKAYLEITF